MPGEHTESLTAHEACVIVSIMWFLTLCASWGRCGLTTLGSSVGKENIPEKSLSFHKVSLKKIIVVLVIAINFAEELSS